MLAKHRHAVGERGYRRQLNHLRLVRLDLERVGNIRVTTGHHQCEVLHHIDVILGRLGVVKTGQRIDVHPPGINGDPILLRAWLLEENILDVVDHIVGGSHRVVHAWPDVVAVIDLLRFVVLGRFVPTRLTGTG